MLLTLSIAVQVDRNAAPKGEKKASRSFSLRQPEQVCRDKGVCTGNETCCGSPSSCCEPQELCCGGNSSNIECCVANEESCCPDNKHGAICCQIEGTFCCPAIGSIASRCCPRWNVCCQGGRYGCCDPGNLRASEDNIAYALFASGTLKGYPLTALNIDLNTGKATSVTTSFPTYGDAPRTFAFSPESDSFYLPQGQFQQNPANVDLWQIVASSGRLNKTTLSSPSPEGLVTGFCAVQGSIIFATYSHTIEGGYSFFKVDPASGSVQTLSQHTFADGKDDYVGWFKRCSPDGSFVIRMGFQNPTEEDTFGVQITDISAPTAIPGAFVPLQMPSGLAQYTSIDVLPTNSSSNNLTFVSLAPKGGEQGDFSLVMWNLMGDAKVLATFKDSHETPKFGPESTAINSEGTQFGAMVTTRNLLSDFDRWELVLYSFVTGNVVQHDLSPWMIAKTDSVSGFAFPSKTTEGLLK